jgi:hypothetical protein
MSSIIGSVGVQQAPRPLRISQVSAVSGASRCRVFGQDHAADTKTDSEIAAQSEAISL